MDAKERLRQYLEQRRELGEQELVLDRLEVDDVLRMVGAMGAGASREPSTGPLEKGVGGGGGVAREPSPEYRRAPSSQDEAASVTAAPSQPEPSDDPGSRAPTESLGDWRKTLRAAGGGPPGQLTPPTTESTDEAREAAEMTRREKADGARVPKVSEAGSAATAPRGTRQAKRGEAAETPGAISAAGAAVLPSWAAELGVPAGLSVGTSAALDDTFTRLSTLDELVRSVEKCTRCELYRTATHAVPGDGNPDADLVCVGEAPGANEDATGHAFVGTAGQLLTKILAAINLSREDVFICNVLKHRPPANRNPAPDEVEACSPYLLRQLELVKPKVILTLGAFAAQTLLETKTPIGKLRGQVHLFHGIPLVVTYHPAALLRNSAWKRPTWEDVQFARRLLDSAARSGA